MPIAAPKAPQLLPLLGLATCLAGCAHYALLPLAVRPQLAPDVATLAQASTTAGPLGVEQIVTLTLANNPDLRAVRAKLGIAQGQVLQAGVLPNPQLAGSFLPLISGAGSVPAWSLGLTQNIKTLITYKATVRAARDSADQVAADLVWQEWQTAGKARQLTADLMLALRSRPAYAEACAMLARRNRQLDAALAAHTTTLVIAAPDRTALQAARSSLDGIDQNILRMRHQLNALLGLLPDAVVPLAESPYLPPFDPAAIRAGIATLPERRPDLLALRLGYAAADENVRAAILAQFPDLVLGGSFNSDNSRVINSGPDLQLGLPIFNRNQGNVAITRATRAQLHDEYAARLAGTVGEVGALLSEYRQLADQLAVAQRELPASRAASARAEQAFAGSWLDERGYVDLVTNRYAKEQEIMRLEQGLVDRQIAIQTLVGAGLPRVALAVEASGSAIVETAQ